MKITKRKIFTIAIVGSFLLTIALFSTLNYIYSNQDQIKDKAKKIVDSFETKTKTPKTSGNWNSSSIILIDGDAGGVGAHNWTWAVAQAWCDGYGNTTDPYIIENMTFSVNSVSAGLTIKDSADYFELNNITITNLGGDGLELNAVSNGLIYASTFELCDNSGIYLNNVNNTQIESSYCLNNTVDGVYAVDSNLNDFIVDCSGNGRYGVIFESCTNNTVVLSQFIDNVVVGVVIRELDEHGDSIENTIYGCTFETNGINAVDNSTLPNIWDNGVIGNIWDDYSGVDIDDDLIGDTPYDIDGSAGSQDNYPFCDDGITPPVSVALPSVSHGHDDDETKEIDLFKLIIFAVIFVSVFVAGFILSKLITISPKTKGRKK